jgi:hypothetical protein
MAGKKLGPRATVLFKAGTGKDSQSQYVYLLKSVADKLGLKTVPDPTITRKAAKGSKKKGEIKVPVRGSVGAKRIKVIVAEATTKTAAKYVSVPVPGSANITDIKKFLSGASKKPASFVSPNGRTYYLTQGKK